jgi:hypothetical protein
MASTPAATLDPARPLGAGSRCAHLVSDAVRGSLGIRVDVASRVLVGAADAGLATH